MNKNVESNKSNKDLNDSSTKEINEKQTVENKNKVELNDNKKINNADNKNSNLDEENLDPADLSSPATQNMKGNIEEADKINENKNLNDGGTKEINKEQTVENKNQDNLNDSKKIDDDKNSDAQKTQNSEVKKMDKNMEHVKNAESNQSNKNLNDGGTKEINKEQTVENKNQVELNDSKKIDDDKNSDAKETQNSEVKKMDKNMEHMKNAESDQSNKNLNEGGTKEINKEQTVENKNQVELNDSKKIDNTGNKNSNLDKENLDSQDLAVPETKNTDNTNQIMPNQGEDEADLTNKIKKFISHAATLTLTDFRFAYVKLSDGSKLNEEEQKKLKANAKVPDDLSGSKELAKLVDILLNINKDNAKDYDIDPKRLDETKFIVSKMLGTDYRKKIVESIDADIANSIIAKDIVIHTMYGGPVQADTYVKKSKFLKKPENFAKVYDIIMNMTEENMYEYVNEFYGHCTIEYYKLILSMLCMACEKYKERQRDVIKKISDKDILKACFCFLYGEEKDIVLNYLPMDLRIKVFIMYKAQLSLVEIRNSATIPECLNTEEARRKLIEEIKSINAGDYMTCGVDGVNQLKFALSRFFTGKARKEIQDSIGDRTQFNKLQIKYIIIESIWHLDRDCGDVASEKRGYNDFLRQNEELLFKTIVQINQRNASEYGITDTDPEDIDIKKFVISSFFSNEELRSEIGKSIGEQRLLDLFSRKLSIDQKRIMFPALPKSIRTVETLERLFGKEKKFWKDKLNTETGKMEPNTFKKDLLRYAVDYKDPDSNNQNNFDFAEYVRQMNNLFRNMFVQQQMQQWQQMQQNLQQQWQYNQYQAQQQQRQQQRIRQMQMLNTDNEERELSQLIAQKNQLEIDYATALSSQEINNRKVQELNSLSNQKNDLETQYSSLKKLLLEYTDDLDNRILAYINSYYGLPRYVTSKNESAKSLFNFCANSHDLLSKHDDLRYICSGMEQIEHAPQLEFSAKWAYAKNFGLSVFYFFGIDAFVRVISGSKNKKSTGELSSEDENEECQYWDKLFYNEKYQSWDKLFYIDAFAFLIGVSMIGLFIFMNLTSIAYMFIAIVATEQVIATILKSCRLNHMPPFILKKQAVADYNEAAQVLVNDVKDFLSGDKSQKCSDLIRVRTKLDDVSNSIDQLQNEMRSRRQSQTHPNIDAAQIGAELNNISNRITMLTNQINLKRRQQLQFFGTTNNNMFGSRIPDMCNNYGTGFNGFNHE